jgi:hypothetical protein
MTIFEVQGSDIPQGTSVQSPLSGDTKPTNERGSFKAKSGAGHKVLSFLKA